MGNGVSQALLGFVLTFWPAPLVGFGTWAVILSNEPRPVYETKGNEYGRPLDGGSSTVDRIETPPTHYVYDARPEEPERLDYQEFAPEQPTKPDEAGVVPVLPGRKPGFLPGV